MTGIYIHGSYIPTENIPRLLKQFDFENDEHYKVRDNGKYKFTIPELETTAPAESSEVAGNTKAAKAKAEFNKELAGIIMWALGQADISNKRIQVNFNMGYTRAERFIAQLENYNLIRKPDSDYHKKSRAVRPEKIGDIPENVMDLLKYNNYSEEDIKNALSKKQGTEYN